MPSKGTRKKADPLQDFRNFLFIAWKHLGLREPTKAQYHLAERLQHGPARDIILAFRGFSKSWITVAFVVWNLRRNPRLNIEVVSAGAGLARNFTTFALQLINSMPILADLKPDGTNGQRYSREEFDVAGAGQSRDPSVKSVGITGQITGTRADLIVPDDVESSTNSLTPASRERLRHAVTEFDNVIKPGGQIKFLGTPHSEDSLYWELERKSYPVFILPARYPDAKMRETYGDRLSPLVAAGSEEDAGLSVEPSRFTDQDLRERELIIGKSNFALQFMLDPNPSDRFKHPLRLQDLIVMDVNESVAPEKVVWAAEPTRAWGNELPMVGLNQDRYYRPMQTIGDWIPYQGAVMAVDPSGRGGDETGYAVAKTLNGSVYVPRAGGLAGGYEEGNLVTLAEIAKEQKVNKIIVEENFGNGMFAQLFRPVLKRIYPCTIEEIHSVGQKEVRIIDTLEPVMNQHRLIVDPKVIQRDFETAQRYEQEKRRQYMLFFQMSRITRDRGSLGHDDRLEALSMAVSHWVRSLSLDADTARDDRQERLRQQMFEDWHKGCVGFKPRQNTGPSWIRLPSRR